MRIIKWSPIELVEPYHIEQFDAIIQNIKDADRLAKEKQKFYFDEDGHYHFIAMEEDPTNKLTEFLLERGNKFIANKYENTEFLFSKKFIKGTFVVYTTPKTPFDD